jgi:YidC/Oxa1 family membrane protein insertase
MAEVLYDLVIFPLQAIIEVLYLLFVRISHSPGFAVIGISLAVNILALPLYAKAEAWQALERGIQNRLKPKIDDIKAVFKGDERLMILSAYYRQNGYHPLYALRSSFGLLLQIPFFIAAYAFIARLPELQGRSFLFIRDLSAPDGLLAAGALKLNFLPILMTLINVAASAVYTKGLAAREKVQLYGMAGLFLVLLYASPSALVLYWTLNNVFSLFKNLIFKARRPLRILYAIMGALAAGAVGYATLLSGMTSRKRLLVAALGAAVLLSPLFVSMLKRMMDRFILPALSDAKQRAAIFFLASSSLAALVGLVIPMSLIASSTQEFSFIGGRSSPFGFILSAFSQAAGIFLFWPVVLYFLFGEKAKAGLAALMPAIAAVALLDVFAFGGAYGTISRQLVFPDAGLLKPGLALNAANLACLLGLAALVALAFAARKAVVLRALLVMCLLSLVSISGFKAFSIDGDFIALQKIRQGEAALPAGAGMDPVFRLSRKGKNVFVIMLDRAISAFVPYMMKEVPALAESYRGFVWYPNTLSFGGHTLVGAPPLFGGYDYTPEEMNRRSGESLVSKHDEALSLMPRIFAEAGWRSTVSDASWAHYSWIPDNSIFRKFPGIQAFNLEGRYTQRWLAEHHMETDPSRKISRNLIRFGLFKIAPMALRFGLYDAGKWWDSKYESDEYADFIDKYAPLEYLPKLVDFEDEGNTFTLMVNNTTHETVPLKYPEYAPSRDAGSGGTGPFADAYTWHTYQVNMAAFKLIGRFLDSLRAQGAYDNTEIIMVADHGFELDNPAFSRFAKNGKRVSYFNPLLMVKGFGASGAWAADRRFGTNADAPAIATAVLGEAVNPFNGHPLRELAPGETVRLVDKSIFDPASQARASLEFDEGDIVRVRDDIFAESNWSFPK